MQPAASPLVQSTTPLFLNGDLRHHPLNKARYYLHHWRRNVRGNHQPVEREVAWPSSPAALDGVIDDLVFDSSPSRMLCDAFWSLIDWPAIRADVGALVVHDLGCGTGAYSQVIRRFAGVDLTYYGFDVRARDSWPQYTDDRTTFTSFDGRDFAGTLACQPNVLMSQSALEHVPEDLSFFRAVSDYCKTRERLAQIHMVPGATGLRQWGLHGWRQYNRDMLRAIGAVFDADVNMTIYCLGSAPMIELHHKWVHNRRRHRAIKQPGSARDRYKAEWFNALARSEPAGVDQASFLTIVIEKGFKDPLWPRLLRQSPRTPEARPMARAT